MPRRTLDNSNLLGYYAEHGKERPSLQASGRAALIAAGKVRITKSALFGAEGLGFDFDDVLGVVKALKPKDFYKSMTTQADHAVWQDVYRPATKAGEVYLKLTVIQDVLIVSFKEL